MVDNEPTEFEKALENASKDLPIHDKTDPTGLGNFANQLGNAFSNGINSINNAKLEANRLQEDLAMGGPTSVHDAMIAADTARLSAMMDDDIILHHITGMTQTKREWLEEVASGSMTYHKIETRDVVVTINSDGSACVSFTSVITATIWGGYGTWTLSGKMRLVRRNGRWIRTE